MSRKIAAYMHVLTVSEEARAEFHENKAGAMTEFGLSAQEQEIVLSDDHARIRAAVAATDAALAAVMVITTIPITTNPPPPPPTGH